MIDMPRTRAEAKKYRYNCWGGNPKGNAYDPEYCAAEVHESGRGILFHQCLRKSGHGPDGLYCPTHDPERVAKRRAEREAESRRLSDLAVERWNRESRIAKACHGLTAEQVEQAIMEWRQRHAD